MTVVAWQAASNHANRISEQCFTFCP